MESKIQHFREGRIFRIIINRPEAKNAFTTAMLTDLAGAYTAFEDDEEAWVAVVSAEGPHFTLGLELDEVIETVRKEEGFPLPEGWVDPWNIRGQPRSKPVIVAAQGYCLTLGIELILAADIALATPQTRFSQLEVGRGIFPFGGGSFRWIQTAGRGNAMRYLLTGDFFRGEEALRLGIVQELHGRDELLPSALELAKKIANQAPLAIRALLENVRVYQEQGELKCREDLRPRLMGIIRTEDAEEGLRSFREKRNPVFGGK